MRTGHVPPDEEAHVNKLIKQVVLERSRLTMAQTKLDQARQRYDDAVIRAAREGAPVSWITAAVGLKDRNWVYRLLRRAGDGTD